MMKAKILPLAAAALAALFLQADPVPPVSPVTVSVAPGTADDPPLLCPLKPHLPPVPFAWMEDGFLAAGRVIPWKELGVTPADGVTFTCTVADQEGNDVVLKVRLRRAAARLRFPSFGQIGRRKVSTVVEVTPKEPGLVRGSFIAFGPRSPVLRSFKNARAKAGETVKLHFVGGPATDLGTASTAVYDTDGKLLYNGYAPFRDPAFRFALRCLWTDRARQTMYVRSDNWFGAARDHRLRVDVRAMDGAGPVVWTATVPAAAVEGMADQPVDVSTLPPGEYKATVTLLSPAGEEIASDYAYYGKPDGKAPWEGTVYGAEDTVPPPWTAPVFGADGFSCWNRRVRFGGDGLVSSIVSADRELLAEPVSILFDGRPLAFDVRRDSVRRADADYVLTARGAPVTARVRCEYDGLMWFEVTYAPPVRSLAVRTALRRALVIGFDDCASAKQKLALPPGATAAFAYAPDRKPWWWMGSTVGLMGGIESFRGWRLRGTASGYRLDVDGAAAAHQMRIVDTPLTDGAPRTFSFYLQPTPTKPKNIDLASVPHDRICGWTGHMGRFYEDKDPARNDPAKIEKFVRRQRAGTRVFWYNASCAISPSFPWWGWFGNEWTASSCPEFYNEELAWHERARKDRSSWTYACPNCPNYFDYKLWSICHEHLDRPEFEMKDLYFDVTSPRACESAVHGCVWKDEFGTVRRDRPVRAVRELLKRVYREMKKKNADGAMMGHLQYQRTPADVFFDLLVMGECYDHDVCQSLSYYDVLTPEAMQFTYASRANETTIVMLPQIRRAIEMFAPDRLKTYSPDDPENDRAIRHATAYFKIHDLGVGIGSDGHQWLAPDRLLAGFGADRRHSAYYEASCPVRVDVPAPRFLYALYEGGGRKLLILLNDPDETVTKLVSVPGLSASGSDIFGKGTYSFAGGACRVTLPPRESRFILFGDAP
jgi:hypothetical protein